MIGSGAPRDRIRPVLAVAGNASRGLATLACAQSQCCAPTPQNSVRAPQNSVRASPNSVRAPQNSVRAPQNSVKAPQNSVRAPQNSVRGTHQKTSRIWTLAPSPSSMWPRAMKCSIPPNVPPSLPPPPHTRQLKPPHFPSQISPSMGATGPLQVQSFPRAKSEPAFCPLASPPPCVTFRRVLLVSFPRSRSPVVGVPGLCGMWRDVPFGRQ